MDTLIITGEPAAGVNNIWIIVGFVPCNILLKSYISSD